jgi:hypothetical protein
MSKLEFIIKIKKSLFDEIVFSHKQITMDFGRTANASIKIFFDRKD